MHKINLAKLTENHVLDGVQFFSEVTFPFLNRRTLETGRNRRIIRVRRSGLKDTGQNSSIANRHKSD